jgi:transposase
MCFVPTKSVDQLDLQALHRVRARLVSQRTAIVNQIRAFLLERGIAVRQGLRFLRYALPDILANRADLLTPRMVNMIKDLAGDLRHLDARIDHVTEEIETLARDDQACQRLMTIPGIGPIIASAMVATIGDGSAFRRGRDFGAWLGLVPRQISTGDRTILGRISKRGNSYLRMLFVQAARVVLLRPGNWPKHSFGRWLEVPPSNACITLPGACCTTGADTSLGSVPRSPKELTARVVEVPPRSARGRGDGKRSRRRFRDLVTQMAA